MLFLNKFQPQGESELQYGLCGLSFCKANTRLSFCTEFAHHVGNLYDWVMFGLGEDALSTSTLNVKA